MKMLKDEFIETTVERINGMDPNSSSYDIDQYSREVDSIDRGIERYHRCVEARGISHTGAGRSVVNQLMKPMIAGIETELIKITQKNDRYLAYMRKNLHCISTDKIAFIAIRAMLDMVGDGYNEIRVFAYYNRIGRLIRDERRFEIQKAMFSDAFKKAKYFTSRDSSRMLANLHKHNGIIDDDDLDWTQNNIIRVGAWVTNAMIEHTGAIQRIMTFKGKKAKAIISLHEETRKMIDHFHHNNEDLRPMNLPMIVKPKPWTQANDGGYLFVRFPFVQYRRGEEFADMDRIPRESMRMYMNAANVLQSTGFVVETRMLGVIEEALKRGMNIPGLPFGSPVPMPPRTPEIDADNALHRKWKSEAKFIHAENAKRRSAMIVFNQKINAAKSCGTNTIYFPHFIDFRGRCYPIPTNFNSQGDDVSRSLLRFSKRLKLGAEGRDRLLITAANLFGVGKESNEFKIQWAEYNMKRIRNSAAAPLAGGQFWEEASNPFQFLSCCFELAQVDVIGTDYESNFICHIDGTCNSMQWITALGRDEKVAPMVNLVDGDEPDDLYSHVAVNFLNKLRRLSIDYGDAMATTWLELVGPQFKDYDYQLVIKNNLRKIAKNPTMTYGYGVTYWGVAAQLEQEFPLKGMRDKTRTEMLARWGARHMVEAIEETIPYAKVIKDFVGGAVRQLAYVNKEARWISPAGLYVINNYNEMDSKEIRTVLGTCVVGSASKNIDIKRQADAATPNFIHCLDASHMAYTVTEIADRNPEISIVAIHDSYGVHASQVKELGRVIRTNFMEIAGSPILENFMKSINEIKNVDMKPPKVGNFNLDKILDSEYFFG